MDNLRIPWTDTTAGGARRWQFGAYSLIAGSSSIVTLGTVTTGTWNATSIDTAKTNAVSDVNGVAPISVATAGKNHIVSITGLKSGANFDTSRFVCDTTVFVTTGLRLAVFVSGMKSTGRIVYSARSAGEPAAPIAADQCGIQCKTDSVVFKRAASGTSALKLTYWGFKY